MRRKLTSIITVLAFALMALFVSCEQNTTEPLASSISVRVTDQTGARTITPEGNVNISHYIITVVNEAEGIEQPSGYLTKGSMFTVSNVPAGTWYAKVDAYIDRGSDTYVKVASDQSEPKAVAAGSSTVFDLVLDTLDEVVSGDVTVTLKMPTALAAQDTAFWYQYTITGMTDESFTKASELAQSVTGADGLATITLDADTLGLLQGAYKFEITIKDADSNPTLTRKGVDVMRLINGLEAKGTIDLATYESDQSFDVTITDKIGDILTPSIQDGQELYELNSETGNTLTVTLTEPLKANETIEWYVDGNIDETVNTDNATTGQYTLTFTNGSHVVTGIVRDTATQMAVGSVSFMVENVNVEFAEKRTKVGETVIVNDIEVLVIATKSEGGTWSSTADATGVEYIGVDKNHDLSYYMEGNDFLNTEESDAISTEAKYGYEWGGYGLATDIQDTAVGTGLTNTNELIEMNLQPDTEDWPVIWDKVEEFRNTHGPNWFVPSKDELNLIYRNRFNNVLNNLSISNNTTLYWTSSEDDGIYHTGAWAQLIDRGPDTHTNKNYHNSRVRLCVQFTEDDIGSAAIGGGDETEESIFTFELNDDQQSYTVTGLAKGIEEFTMPANGVLEIPATYLDKSVTEIGYEAFSRRTDIVGSVVIPDSVTSIGSNAFYRCSALETVEISDTSQLASIGNGAFAHCGALKDVIIPDSVTSIGLDAFRECFSLTKINLPDSVTSIGASAFENCKALETIEISDTSQLASIGESAFLSCDKILNIYIPDSVTSIGRSAFYQNSEVILDIYCESDEKPEGWDNRLVDSGWANFYWNVPYSEYDAIMNNGSVPYEVPQPLILEQGTPDGMYTIDISCRNDFAHIYYTTNGETPTTDNGTLYTEPFTVSEGDTIKAVAYVGNGIYSDIVSFGLGGE